MYKSGFFPPLFTNLRVSVGVPDYLRDEEDGSNQSLGDNEMMSMHCSNSSAIKCDVWDEIDESEQYTGAVDTMLITPGFVEEGESDCGVFSFTPAEGNKPLSIFKDKYSRRVSLHRNFLRSSKS